MPNVIKLIMQLLQIAIETTFSNRFLETRPKAGYLMEIQIL